MSASLKQATSSIVPYTSVQNLHSLITSPNFILNEDTNDKPACNGENNTNDYREELLFLKTNLDILKKLTSSCEEGQFLVLDKQIYDPNARFVNKNIKVNQQVYE